MKTAMFNIRDEYFDSFCEHMSKWNRCPYDLGLYCSMVDDGGCTSELRKCEKCYAQSIEKTIELSERFYNERNKVVETQNEVPEKQFPISMEEATRLCEFIELNFIKYIRADEDIDNMSWVILMTDLFNRMAEFCQYNGFTYRVGDKDD